MESNKDEYKFSILDKDEKVYMFFESDLQELIANERAAEREECAQLVENMQQAAHRGEGIDGWDAAYAIRARGQE